MIREFKELIDEAVDEGYTVGVNLFLENLDVDIQKEEAIVEYKDEDILIKTLFTKEGYEITEG